MKTDINNEYIVESFKIIESYDSARIASTMDMRDPLAGKDQMFSMDGVSDNMTIVPHGTTVDGIVTTNSAVSVNGKVNGKVCTTSDVGVTGIVSGDIDARNASFSHAGLRGDVKASEDVSIDNGSVVVGNIKAKNVILNSKIKGDILASGKVSFRKNTLAVGNITAGLVNMEDGAVISAAITLSSQNHNPEDFDKEFNMEV